MTTISYQNSTAEEQCRRTRVVIITDAKDLFLCDSLRALFFCTLSRQRSRFYVQSSIHLRHLAEVWQNEFFVSCRLSMCQVHFSYNGAERTQEKKCVPEKVCLFLKDIGATVLTGQLFLN